MYPQKIHILRNLSVNIITNIHPGKWSNDPHFSSPHIAHTHTHTVPHTQYTHPYTMT